MQEYERLLTVAPSTVPDPQLCAILRSLPANHAKMVYALMLHHFIHVTGQGDVIVPRRGRRTMYPYGCELLAGGRGLIVTLTNLPRELQQIIRSYITVLPTS